jgi:acyl dehydratase
MNVGERFERRVRWTRDEVVAFACEVGDTNPIHHDEAYAAGTRFGGLIASGAQTVAYLTALCGAQSRYERPGVGLAFDFRLVGAARPGEEIVFGWEVIAATPSERPRGTLVDLRGEAVAEGGRTLVTATARVLYVTEL